MQTGQFYALTNLDELGQLHAARVAWRNPVLKARLCHVWSHPEHPHRESFARKRVMYDEVLSAPVEEMEAVAGAFGETVRTVAKDLPSVFPRLWVESRFLGTLVHR